MFIKTKLFILKENAFFKLWLNADILHGPINAKDPVPADNFMQLCKKYFPDCLNLRWVSSTHFLAVFQIHLHFNLVSSLLSRMTAQKNTPTPWLNYFWFWNLFSVLIKLRIAQPHTYTYSLIS